MIKKLL